MAVKWLIDKSILGRIEKGLLSRLPVSIISLYQLFRQPLHYLSPLVIVYKVNWCRRWNNLKGNLEWISEIKARKERIKKKLAHAPGVVQFVVFKKLKGANLFQINFTSNQLWLTLNWTFCSVWLQLTRYQPISILILFAYISCLHILIVFLLGSWIRCQENMQMSLNNTCPPVYQLYIVFS